MNIERLRELRNKAGISQSDMAKILKISRQAYNHYETGSREPNNETMIIIANTLDCSVDYLLGRKQNTNAYDNLNLNEKQKKGDIMNVIKELRTKKNISQSKLAKILNVHQTAVSQWEKNRTFPDAETLKRIADYFDVSVDYLVGHTSDRNSTNNNRSDNFIYEISKITQDLTAEEKDRILAFVRFTKSQRAKDNFGGNVNFPQNKETPKEAQDITDKTFDVKE